jgi:serine/threonine-protein kinase
MHPNIAAVFGAGEENGVVFLVMELVEGKTLRAILKERGGLLGIDEALRLTRAIAAGLAAAHEAGIIHRDLKPENVMVTGDGQVKILDFGIAKRISSGAAAGPEAMTTATELVTVEGRIMGTPSYMPPEQAKGGAVDARSDIFALATIDPAAADWHGTTSTRELLAWQVFVEAYTPTQTLCAELETDPEGRNGEPAARDDGYRFRRGR